MTRAALLLALTSTTSLAQIHQGDIAVANGGDRIQLGSFENAAFVEGCVFAVDLTSGINNDPGYDTENGEFPTTWEIGPTIRSPLQLWNTTGFEQASVQMTVQWGPFPTLSPANQGETADAIALGVNGSGEWHIHYTYIVPAGAAPGVYLLELELRNQQGSIGTSMPYWLVFDHGASPADLDEALAFVRDEIAWCTATADCPGDVTTTGATEGQPAFGTPDGVVDLSDLLFFVNAWQAQIGPNPGAFADVTTTGAGEGDPDFGQPDGEVNLSDLLYFVNRWNTGRTECP